MALRFLLVSLVAGLGIQPPSLPEATAWANAGRDWIQARFINITGAPVVANRAPTDDEFDGVVADMAERFSIDLAAIDRPASKPPMVFESIDVAEQLNSGIAYCLNRCPEIEGVSPAPVGSSIELGGSLPGPTHATVAPAGSGEPCRSCRLASAVRLTRQAALAWMTLLRDVDLTAIRY